MEAPGPSSPDSFLATVRRHLKGLDSREQLEILREVADHLEDAAAALRESGLSDKTSTETAVADMGNPAEVGRRLRDEHLARRLPWRHGLLVALPLLVPALGLGEC